MKVTHRSLIVLIAGALCALTSTGNASPNPKRLSPTAGQSGLNMHNHNDLHSADVGESTKLYKTGRGERLDQLRLQTSSGTVKNYVIDLVRHRTAPARRIITTLRRGFAKLNVFSTIASSTAALATSTARFGRNDTGDPGRNAVFA